jgi:hypothetical protein
MKAFLGLMVSMLFLNLGASAQSYAADTRGAAAELMACKSRQWMVLINENNRSSKADIASALALVGSPAAVFKLKSISELRGSSEMMAVFTVGETPMDHERFYKSGLASFEQILELPGMIVECDFEFQPL